MASPKGIRLTLKDIKILLRPHGISINKNQYGEYRVNYIGGKEVTAVYETSLADGLATAEHMARERHRYLGYTR